MFDRYDKMSDGEIEQRASERKIVAGTPSGYDRQLAITQLRSGDAVSRNRIGLAIAIISVSVGLATWFALFPRSPTPPTDDPTTGIATTTMSLECHRVLGFPSLEPSGIVRRYYFAPGDEDGFVGGTNRSDDGIFEWEEHPKTCFRYELINDGEVPVFDAEVAFQAIFMEAVVTGATTMSSGATTSESPRTLAAPRVDPGSDEAFVFFVMNASDQFLTLISPGEVSLRVAGHDGTVTVPVIAVGDALFFPPEFSPRP